ncbi:MAG: A/G-specific adenine glycosylase [Burkholderiales bacterium]
MSAFASRIVAWQRTHGRHDLPWQGTRDPYRIWLSEVMLQQTQVATVIPYYQRFVARFRDVHALAQASLDEVLALWSGLGYYSRARNLHRAARLIVEAHGGEFPRSHDEVLRLPGVGRSTAAAILAFSHGERRAILDGNVKRVLARAFAVRGYPGEPRVASELWRIAEALLPDEDIEPYTQGLMDLGASVCTRAKPRCMLCPVATECAAHVQGREDAYPEPRPVRRLPERETMVVVYIEEGAVMLERRPPTGVWGGLWALPEAAVDADPERLCHARFGVAPMRIERLGVIRHAFTHFKLTMHPVAVWLSGAAPRAQESDAMWLLPEQAGKVGLPAPLKPLLASLQTLESVSDAEAA